MKKNNLSRLRELRGKRSQADFSALFGVKQATYSNWEQGRQEPSLEILMRISQTFSVSIDWILGLTDRKTIAEPTSGLMVAEGSPAYGAEEKAVISLLERAVCAEARLKYLEEELHRQRSAHQAELTRMAASHQNETETLRGIIRDITSALSTPSVNSAASAPTNTKTA